MLTPAQVIPFLTHDDRLVRRQALTYFRGCPDPAPLTADHYWAAIDHLGGVGPAARSFLAHLPRAPQTDASVQRLVAELAEAADRDDVFDLRRTVRELPFPVLSRNRDLILGCREVGPELTAFLERRLALADVSADDAWDQLTALARRMPDTDEEDEEAVAADDNEAEALVEAAARHIAVVAAPATATLDDVAASGDWREVLAVRVLGLGRHGPATGPLVEKLLVEDDYLRDEAVEALGRIGTADVVDRLVDLAAGRPGDAWSYAVEPIGRIKVPQSEAGLLRLLAVEADDERRGWLLQGLCDLCSLARLDAARQYIVADPTHPESLELCESLLAVAAMHGTTLPEEPRWRARLAARDASVAARMKALDAGDLGAFVRSLADRFPGLLGDGDAAEPDELPPPPALPGDYDPYARIMPIRNAGPKVGRNDPCPCGSGKKHKKCCGAAT